MIINNNMIIFSKRTYLYTSYIQFDIVDRSCVALQLVVNVLFIIYTVKCKLIFSSHSSNF